MKNGWRRATKAKPCPCCQQGDGCLVTTDGGAAICRRVSDGAKRIVGSWGWLHQFGTVRRLGPLPARSMHAEPARVYDWAGLAGWFARQAVGKVAGLAAKLGVSAASLERLGVGKQGDSAWTFPMRDGAGAIVGIRVRYESGVKRTVSGSRSGLFVPSDPNGGPVYVCEGPTDTAALLTIGLSAVGRASCTEGARELAVLLRGHAIVIVSDNDKPGMDGAARLARILAGARVIRPPDGIKDARAWVNAGATKKDVEARCREAGCGVEDEHGRDEMQRFRVQ